MRLRRFISDDIAESMRRPIYDHSKAQGFFTWALVAGLILVFLLGLHARLIAYGWL